MPPGPKKKDGTQKEHPQNLGPQGHLPIFEFESVFFNLGRSRAFDLRYFFRVSLFPPCAFCHYFPPYAFVVILRHYLKVTLPSFRPERRYFFMVSPF